MSWQNYWNGRMAWQRYIPDPEADPWQVCPACSTTIQRHDAKEQARDRRDLWITRLVYLLVIASIIGACVLLRYLGSH
jgi:hypothetical protein